MPRNRVEFFLRARDQASRTLNKVQGNLTKLLGVRNLFPAFLGGAGLAGIAAALNEITQRGSQVAAVQEAFSRSTEGNTTALGQLRAASEGLIGNYELMVGFNRALSLGAANNVQDYQKLIRASIQLGRAQGCGGPGPTRSRALVLGLGRQSVADPLGQRRESPSRPRTAYKAHAAELSGSQSPSSTRTGEAPGLHSPPPWD